MESIDFSADGVSYTQYIGTYPDDGITRSDSVAGVSGSFAEITMPTTEVSGGGLLFYGQHREEAGNPAYYKWLSIPGYNTATIAANTLTSLDTILSFNDTSPELYFPETIQGVRFEYDSNSMSAKDSSGNVLATNTIHELSNLSEILIGGYNGYAEEKNKVYKFTMALNGVTGLSSQLQMVETLHLNYIP